MRTVLLAVMALALAPLSPAAEPTSRPPRLSREEQRIARWIDAHADDAVTLLARVVDMNSGTQNVEGVRAVGEVFRAELAALGFDARLAEQPPETRRGPHVFAERKGDRGRRLLLIGHLDTVFEKDSPFQRWERAGTTAKGPGAADMKGGDVIVLYALKALHAARALDRRPIVVAFTGDEEDPGPVEISRKELVEVARRSDVALGFEATVELGRGTVARRGASEWQLEVSGMAAHSSGIFGERVGAGAVFEASRILRGFYDELAREPNLTFNPGVILGGSDVAYDWKTLRGTAAGKTNIVVPQAVVHGDLRFLSEDVKERARERMRRIVSQGNLPRTSARITFQDSYPAMEPKPGNYALLARLDEASRALGSGPVGPLDPGRRGAGDVSFVAASVDCLDGLGAMGSGSHTDRETVDLQSLPVLIKRAAILIHRLGRD